MPPLHHLSALSAGFAALVSALWLTAAPAQEKAGPSAAAPPPPTLTLGKRSGRVVPQRQGFNHTGGGNIDVAQPAPDTLVITMTGVAVAGKHPCKDSLAALDFELTQDIDVALEKPQGRNLKLTLEGRVIGLLRSTHKGVAEESGGSSVCSGPTPLLTLEAPAHTVSGGDSLSLNDRLGPVSVPIAPGTFSLHQAFRVAARHPFSFWPSKASSSEFAPDPALDPLWISYWEPFHGANKKDFGYQVLLRVVAE
jgi:hypothetical protein